MARTRTLLVDNTLGKIFTNVQNVSGANATNLIAGTKLQAKAVSSAAAVRVAKNLGVTGIYFPTETYVTTAVLLFTKPPTNGGTTIVLRKGANYDASTIISTTAITANTVRTTVTLNTTVSAGQSIYVDVTTAAAINSGIGLKITANYYAS